MSISSLGYAPPPESIVQHLPLPSGPASEMEALQSQPSDRENHSPCARDAEEVDATGATGSESRDGGDMWLRVCRELTLGVSDEWPELPPFRRR